MDDIVVGMAALEELATGDAQCSGQPCGNYNECGDDCSCAKDE